MNLQRLLPEFSNAIDRKIRDCLNNTRVVRRIEPLESRVDLLAAITPSILSYISQHSRSSRSVRSGAMHHQELEDNIEATHANDDGFDYRSFSSTKTVRKLAPLSQTPPPLVDTRMASPTVDAEVSVSCGGTATPTMRSHALEGISVSSLRDSSVLDAASYERSQGYCELQRRPLCLRKGEVVSHSFDMENAFLQVHVLGLQVDLQYDTSPAQGSRLERKAPQTQGKPLQLEIECLSSPIHGSDYSLAQVVDLDEVNWVEKTAPEGVLFSPEGLLLKQRSTLLRLRARSA